MLWPFSGGKGVGSGARRDFYQEGVYETITLGG